MVVLASNSITARAQPDPLSVRYDERHERRDGLTERRATRLFALRRATVGHCAIRLALSQFVETISIMKILVFPKS